MSAEDTLQRIVLLVALLTDWERQGRAPAPLATIAHALGVTARQVEEDIRTLTLLGERADSDWLLSLRVWQQKNRVSITSRGPFRRPMRFTPEELLVVQLALIGEDRGRAARALNATLRSDEPGAPQRSARRGQPLERPESSALAREGQLTRIHQCEDAIRSGTLVRLEYASASGTPRLREVEPYQLVDYRHHAYLVGWCGTSGGWRRFRLDRIVSLTPSNARFTPRADFRPVEHPTDLFQAGRIEEVTVRFTGSAASWARERYPGCEQVSPEAVLVRYQVADPEWLIRQVLEVGADAEVVAPPAWRRVMRDAVA